MGTSKAEKAETKEKKEDLIYKKTAIEILGITPKSFNSLGLEPVKEVVNPHYSQSVSYLYDRKIIEKLAKTKKIAKLRPKPRNRVDYDSKFVKKYGSPGKAMLDASQALFNLNRYCKHKSCSKMNKEEIYELKNAFIRKLYQLGYCQTVDLHEDKKACFDCSGTGKRQPFSPTGAYEECLECLGVGYLEDYINGEIVTKTCPHCKGKRKVFEAYEDDGSGRCLKCSGTGVYHTISYYVFHFCLEDQSFTWHQPQKDVDYPVETTEVSDINQTEVKPLEIPKAKLTQAKALVRWICNSDLQPKL